MREIDKLVIACVRMRINTSSQINNMLKLDKRHMIAHRLRSLISKGYIEDDAPKSGTARLTKFGRETPYYGLTEWAGPKATFRLSKSVLADDMEARIVERLDEVDRVGIFVPLKIENIGLKASVFVDSDEEGPAYKIKSNTGVAPRSFGNLEMVRQYIKTQSGLRRNGFGTPWAEVARDTGETPPQKGE